MSERAAATRISRGCAGEVESARQRQPRSKVSLITPNRGLAGSPMASPTVR